ncbi:MAG TPA: tetratricopeptide repeat protein [Sphingobium sp.]
MTVFRYPTLALLILLSGLIFGAPRGAMAQDQTVSQLDLQRPQDVNTLNTHLARLAENPRDVTALVGAGEAALALDDARAATGFFARANEIEPNNGRIKAGLGQAMLDMQNPGEALKLFDQATRLGFPDTRFLSDRGLARDLTGDIAGAQRDYQAALRTTPNDAELIRRYAVSLGISGQIDAAEKALKPLLYKGDRGAWRDRAFILAMNGRRDEARDIATKTMPARLAVAIQPYLDRMQGLTPAQRAAAVQFGNFPADTGVRVAAAEPQKPAVQPVAPQKAVTLTAAQQRAARKAERQKQRDAQKAAEAARRAPAPKPGTQIAVVEPEPVPPPPPSMPAQMARAEPRPVPEAPARQPAAAVIQRAPEPAAQPVTRPQSAMESAPRPVQGPPAPEPAAATSLPMAARETPAPAPLPPPVQAAPAAAAPTQLTARTLADIMRELQVPDEEKKSSADAVNLADLEMLQQQRKTAKAVAAEKARAEATAKAKAAADVKAKAEAAEKARLAKNPSRAWVQVGTGRSIPALAFTMKGLRKKYESLAAKDAWTASWGQTNRLVVGPFASFDKAKEYEERLKKGGADAFAWRSDAGEDVSKLAAN